MASALNTLEQHKWLECTVREAILHFVSENGNEEMQVVLFERILPIQLEKWQREIGLLAAPLPDTYELHPELATLLSLRVVEQQAAFLFRLKSIPDILEIDRTKLILNAEVLLFVESRASTSLLSQVIQVEAPNVEWLVDRDLHQRAWESFVNILDIGKFESNQDIRHLIEPMMVADGAATLRLLAAASEAALALGDANAVRSIAYSSVGIDPREELLSSEFGQVVWETLEANIERLSTLPPNARPDYGVFCDPFVRMLLSHDLSQSDSHSRFALAGFLNFSALDRGIDVVRLGQVAPFLDPAVFLKFVEDAARSLCATRTVPELELFLSRALQRCRPMDGSFEQWIAPEFMGSLAIALAMRDQNGFMTPNWLAKMLALPSVDALADFLGEMPPNISSFSVANWLLRDETLNDELINNRLAEVLALHLQLTTSLENRLQGQAYEFGLAFMHECPARIAIWLTTCRVLHGTDRLATFSSLHYGGILFSAMAADSLMGHKFVEVFKRIRGTWNNMKLSWELSNKTPGQKLSRVALELAPHGDFDLNPSSMVSCLLHRHSNGTLCVDAKTIVLSFSQALLELEADSENQTKQQEFSASGWFIEFWGTLCESYGDHQIWKSIASCLPHIASIASGFLAHANENSGSAVSSMASREINARRLKKIRDGLANRHVNHTIHSNSDQQGASKWFAALRLLQETGRPSQAMQLFREKIDYFERLLLSPDAGPLPDQVGLLGECVKLSIQSRAASLVERMRDLLLAMLRARFNQSDHQPDREHALGWTEECRHLVVEATNALQVLVPTEQAGHALNSLLLDAELTQRTVAELVACEPRQLTIPAGPRTSSDIESLTQKVSGINSAVEGVPELMQSSTIHVGGSRRRDSIQLGMEGVDANCLGLHSSQSTILRMALIGDDTLVWSLLRCSNGQIVLTASGSNDQSGCKTSILEEIQKFDASSRDPKVSDLSTHHHRCKYYLDRVSKIIHVEDIVEYLNLHDDLVFMVDGVMGGLPLSFLPIGDKFLFEYVRTTRTVVSALAYSTLLALESEVASRGPSITISGIHPLQIDYHPFAIDLLRSQQNVALRTGYDWRGAWLNPTGCHDVFAREIAIAEQVGKPITLLTVLAHGDFGVAELIPPDGFEAELWSGRDVVRFKDKQRFSSPAVNLHSVEFLLQISCQLGKISKRELSDSRGFCIDLLSRGARSVAAAKWPIFAIESVIFAEELSRTYLELRSSQSKFGVTLLRGTPRALAVAKIRKDWLYRDQPIKAKIGLHTMAAFELFGFG